MKPIPLNAETEPIASSLIWFEPPEEGRSGAFHGLRDGTRHPRTNAHHSSLCDRCRFSTGPRQRSTGDHRPALLGLLELETRPLSRAATALAPACVVASNWRSRPSTGFTSTSRCRICRRSGLRSDSCAGTGGQWPASTTAVRRRPRRSLASAPRTRRCGKPAPRSRRDDVGDEMALAQRYARAWMSARKDVCA